jgi:hypothetical protein
METFPFLSTKNLQFAQQISHDDFFTYENKAKVSEKSNRAIGQWLFI